MKYGIIKGVTFDECTYTDRNKAMFDAQKFTHETGLKSYLVIIDEEYNLLKTVSTTKHFEDEEEKSNILQSGVAIISDVD